MASGPAGRSAAPVLRRRSGNPSAHPRRQPTPPEPRNGRPTMSGRVRNSISSARSVLSIGRLVAGGRSSATNDAVAMLPLAVAAVATSGPVLRAPLIVVVLFCIGCLGILTLGQRVARLPLVGRSDRLHAVYPARRGQHTVLATDAPRRSAAPGLLDIARPREHPSCSAPSASGSRRRSRWSSSA